MIGKLPIRTAIFDAYTSIRKNNSNTVLCSFIVKNEFIFSLKCGK